MKSAGLCLWFVVFLCWLLFTVTNVFAGSNIWGEVKELMGEQGRDYFGNSVAIDGDRAIVGAFNQGPGGGYGAGAAYIYERNLGGANAWGEEKKLVASDGALQDYFGISVAVDGDTVIVGATCAGPCEYCCGKAYIYERNMGGMNAWGEVIKLTAANPTNNDTFGSSVAIDGDIAVIGSDEAAYVYGRNTGGLNAWGLMKKLTASDGYPGDHFGSAVAIAGDRVIVGAYGNFYSNNYGVAYVFGRNTGGANYWGELKILTTTNALAYNFGVSVAMASDYAIIGADQEVIQGVNFCGAAYVFGRNAGGVDNWGRVKRLTADGAPASDHFGNSVGLTYDTPFYIAVVGACGGSTPDKAYIFEQEAGWNQVKKLVGSDTLAGDKFGCSVAIEKDVAIVGAYMKDTINTDAGAAYIFGLYGPAPSDLFAGAESLPGGNGIASGSNVGATTEAGEPAHAGNGGPYHSVWWNWASPTMAAPFAGADGDVLSVNTHGSDFDTVLAVYTGPAVNNLTQVAANDDSGAGIQTSEVTFPFSSGVPYHIAVDGKTAGDTGTVVVNYEIIPEPVCGFLLFTIVCVIAGGRRMFSVEGGIEGVTWD